EGYDQLFRRGAGVHRHHGRHHRRDRPGRRQARRAAGELRGLVMAENSEIKWYVVHTYSGYENKVKVNLEKAVENNGMQDVITEVTIPTEEVVEIKNSKRKVVQRKLLPGYVLVKMLMTNETWYIVR